MPDRRFFGATPDPEVSADPRVRQLVTALRAIPGPVPRRQFHNELRTQLIAVTPALVREPLRAEPTLRPRRHRVRRAFAVAGVVVVLAALVLSGLAWFSRNALPGDTLYGVKRARENVALAFSGGGVDRGRTYLDQSVTRANEVLKVWTSSINTAHPPTTAAEIPPRADDLMTQTLDDTDASLRDGSRLITSTAVRNGSSADLSALTTWAPGQIKLLSAISQAIPVGTLHQRAAEAATLVNSSLQRALVLRTQIGTGCLSPTAADALGPLPCGTPGGPPAPGTSPSGPSTGPSSGGASSSPSPSPSSGASPSSGG